MNLIDRARAGTRQRLRPIAAGAAVAVVAGLALPLGPAALAAPTSTWVGCSAAGLSTAVSSAQSGAVLSLASRCNYVLTSTLEATVSLTIRGNNDTITTGASGLTLLLVDAGTTVSLSDLTLSNGAPAIQNAGTVNVSYSTFSGNAEGIATTGGSPPGRADGTVNVTDSDFDRNNGAITNFNGTVNVAYSDFYRNNNGAIAGTVNARVCDLCGALESIITVTDSDFEDNSSPGDGGAVNAGNGQATLNDDDFYDNTAAGYGGAVAGEACRNEGNNVLCGTLSIDDGYSSGNTAAAGGAIANGGIPLTLTDNSELWDNAATGTTNGYGGAIYGGGTVSNTSIHDNTASVDGGGIYGAATLTHTEVRYNSPDNCAPAGTIAGCSN